MWSIWIRWRNATDFPHRTLFFLSLEMISIVHFEYKNHYLFLFLSLEKWKYNFLSVKFVTNCTTNARARAYDTCTNWFSFVHWAFISSLLFDFDGQISSWVDSLPAGTWDGPHDKYHRYQPFSVAFVGVLTLVSETNNKGFDNFNIACGWESPFAWHFAAEFVVFFARENSWKINRIISFLTQN